MRLENRENGRNRRSCPKTRRGKVGRRHGQHPGGRRRLGKSPGSERHAQGSRIQGPTRPERQDGALGGPKVSPDLILLDINMPEMNGYEVCEHLKADKDLAGIPVIFISALNENMDKVKAFAIGGVDYITKPFQMEELHARVETHLKLRRLQVELEEPTTLAKANDGCPAT